MGARTWIKVYCEKWLTGTLREETPEIRGVWIDLLALAGSGKYGDIGEIKLATGVGFTDSQIAALLHIPQELWLTAKQRFTETERIEIALDNNIKILNWQKYQSEYTRQKEYREQSDNQKLQPKVTTKSSNREVRSKNREVRSKNIDSSYSPAVFELFQSQLGKVPSEMAKRLENYTAENIRQAAEEAIKRGKPHWGYVEGILKNKERMPRQPHQQKQLRRMLVEQDYEWTPERLEAQARLDAEALHDRRDQLTPERIAAAEAYIKAHGKPKRGKDNAE